MPMGMHTVVAEGVNTLSGGQRQRIMIARAIARRPRILLFDEATSSLDNQSQAIVSASLGNLNVTRIVIAHRLSTVCQADRIIVLVDGKVAQTGTFTELSNTPGVFASFAQRQLL
jgi:ABC-type bacteriocin/lantibiotic exporter with double-glycine peptidase domain